MPTAIIHIKGMTCGGCVNSVKTVLKKIPGVSNVEVSLSDGQAIIQHDGSCEDIIFDKAITKAGFEPIKQ